MKEKVGEFVNVYVFFKVEFDEFIIIYEEICEVEICYGNYVCRFFFCNKIYVYEKCCNNYEVLVYGLIILWERGERSFLNLKDGDGVFNYFYNILKIWLFFRDF